MSVCVCECVYVLVCGRGAMGARLLNYVEGADSVWMGIILYIYKCMWCDSVEVSVRLYIYWVVYVL